MPKNSTHKSYFVDRKDAANQLFESLPLDFFKDRDTMVVAISEGAVEIADILARRLKCDMDILLTESVSSRNNPELSIAKVSETQDIVIHKVLIESFDIDEDIVYDDAKHTYEDKIIPHIYKYRKNASIKPVEGKAVILVDECVETDFTALVSIKSMIGMQAKSVYVATPILDTMSYDSLVQLGDGVFCPHQIRDYISIEYYYENLEKPEFKDIEGILNHYE